ncbi:MAG TPA: site-specific integrase [Alicycliphilus sp.]|nr:site-specific integrase [Alicycliphilus sp.]
MAKTLALRLAAEWLVRFSHEPEAPLDEHPSPAEIGQSPLPLVVAPPEPVAPALSRAAQATPDTSGLSPHVANMLALYRYWRGLNTDRAPSTVREFERLTRTFDKFMQKTPAQLMRTDITAYRDHLLQRGDARKTVTKKLSFVSAMLQTAYDAGYGVVPIERLVAAVGSLKLPVDLPCVM